MPWTDSRSRDEWLAEVRRRGGRMRVRRRLALSAVGAVALLGPVFAAVSYSSDGGGDRQFQMAAGGPAPTSGGAGPSLPTVLREGEALATTTTLAGAVALPEVTAPPGPLAATTTTEVHRRVSSINGVPSSDDPVIRPASTTTIIGSGSAASSPAVAGPPSTVLPPSSEPALSACPTDGVEVTVTIDRPSYAPGDTVTWSSTLANRSGATCLVSGRAFFHVEDTGGTIVGAFPYTADYMLPVKAEHGKTITNTGAWDQKDCSGPACTPVSTGTYVVVAKWTEGGPWVGRGSFEISA